MSDNHNEPAHEEAHTGPIKTPKQLLLAAFFSFVVPIFAIIGLVLTNNSGMLKLMRSLGFTIKAYPDDPDFRLVTHQL